MPRPKRTARTAAAHDRRKTPSKVWMCRECGKRGTAFWAKDEDGRLAGSFYECPNGHRWDRPYD